MPPSIRPATPADAARLSAFGAGAFRDAFGPHNTPADMARYLADAFSAGRQAAEIASPHDDVLLAEEAAPDGEAELAGYAHVAGGTPPAVVTGPAPVELKRLYVGRRWHGRGVAQALMAAVFDAARARGAQTLWLGVWEHNPRAVAFYAKYGFARVGEHAFRLGDDLQTDWLMARPLADAPAAAPPTTHA